MTTLIEVQRPAPPAALEAPTKALLAFMAEHENIYEGQAVPLAVIPIELRTPQILTAADRAGWIEFGERNHSTHGKWKDGRDKFETKTTPAELQMEPGFQWTSLCKPGRKHIQDVIAEYAKRPEPLQLHLRLTPDGLIQTPLDLVEEPATKARPKT